MSSNWLPPNVFNPVWFTIFKQYAVEDSPLRVRLFHIIPYNNWQSVLQIGSPALQSHCIFLYIPYTNSLPPHPTSHNENCTDFLWKASLYAKLRGGCAHNTFAISITFTKSHNKIIQIEIGQTLDLTTPHQSHINSQRKIFMYILDKKKKS